MDYQNVPLQQPNPSAPVAATGIPYKRLKQTHPRLDLERVKILQAMYRGGNNLLGNAKIMETVFPKYTYEKDGVYKERCRRAFYENIFALVINQISAGLAQDPIRIATKTETVEKSSNDEAKKLIMEADQQLKDEEGEPLPEDEELEEPIVDDEELEEEEPTDPVISEEVVELEVDPFWNDFIQNATALSDDGSNWRSFDQVIRNAAVEALVTGWSWLQTDLPKPDDELPPPTSLAEQEQDGSLRAYVVPWATDCVTDWEERNGKLLWVRTYVCEIPAEDPARPRDTKLHTWTIWTKESYTKYRLEEKQGQPLPGDETIVPVLESAPHTFGRVPWTRLDVSSYGGAYLHIGDIIESLCRNYFNRQNGEAFQWTQFNYQQLYEFLGPEISGIDTPVAEAQGDPNRAKKIRSPGEVHVRGADDKAMFVSPNMQGADVGRNALQDLRDAILRVVAQMALAQDTSGAMLRRSADSKRQDSVAQEIVLGAIGKLLVVLANHIAKLLAAGRGDPEEPPEFTGYQHFNVMDAESMINQSVMVEGINIPSATYQVEQKCALAYAHLGDNITPEIRQKIKDELMQAITQDQFTQPPPMPPGMEEISAEEEVDENGEPVEPELDENGEPVEPEKEKEFPPKKKKSGGKPPWFK